MFKKTLLASALSVAALNASAAVVAITGNNVSQEGAAGQASIAVPNAVVTLGAEYTLNDSVTFTITGAEFDTTLSAPALAGALLGSDGAAGGAGDAADDAVTFGLLNVTANSVTFRITAQTDGGTDGVTYTDALGGAYANGTFTLSGMVMKTATVLDATGDITVAYSALTNNQQAIDTAGTLSDVAQTVVAQFSSASTKSLNGVIDVNNDRYQFTAGDDTTTTDVLTVTVSEAVAATHDATYDGATHTIKGSFMWMDDDEDGTVEAAELATHFAAAGAGDDTFVSTINAAGDTITAVATDGGADAVEAHNFTFTAVPADKVVLPTQTITVSTEVDYTTAAAAAADKVTATDAAAGAWTLNGKVATIPYMPFGDNTQVIMRATNTGTQTGDVTVRYMLEGVDSTWNEVSGTVTSLAPGVTNIADLVLNAIKADAGVTKGKVAIEITANVPTGDASVYAAYKVVSETDRGFVGIF
jgi:hypothetical protein